MEIIKQRVQKTDGSIKFYNYQLKNYLGKGSYAECWEVQRLEDKKRFALKIIPKALLIKEQSNLKMRLQLQIHRSVKHQNICKLQRDFQDKQHVYLLLQLCKNRSFSHLLQKRRNLSIPEVQHWIYQLIDAVAYLHSRNIIHRDIKIGNLLLNDKMCLKLGDFGLSTKLQFVGDRKHQYCGSPNYMAPQIVRPSLKLPNTNSGYSFSIDIWGIGVVLYTMLIGTPPFDTKSKAQTFSKISQCKFSFPENFKDDAAIDLIKHILVINPQERYDIEQILSHPFMKPDNGILKEISIKALQKPTKLEFTQINSQGVIKDQAKSAIIDTCRTIRQQMSQQIMRVTSKTKIYCGSAQKSDILNSILGVSSLPKSIEKLNNLKTSMTDQDFKLIQNGNPESRGGYSPRNKCINLFGSQKSKNKHIVYVIEFKKEIIWTYLLNNGYIGTYQPNNQNYKLLYNCREQIYLEIQNDDLPKVIKGYQIEGFQNIMNRQKYIKKLARQGVEDCQPFSPLRKPVYIKRVYSIVNNNMLFFILSNGDYQLFNIDNKTSLIISDYELILIEFSQDKQVKRTNQFIKNCVKSQNQLLKIMYAKAKKVLSQIKILK